MQGVAKMTDGVLNGGRVARVVLLACGSYNPITNMHLRMFGMLFIRYEYLYFAVTAATSHTKLK